MSRPKRDMRAISVRLPQDLFDRLETIGEDEHWTITQVLIEATKVFLEVRQSSRH